METTTGLRADMQGQHAVRACNSDMQFQHGDTTCRDNMYVQLAIAACNCRMQLPHAIDTCYVQIPRAAVAAVGVTDAVASATRNIHLQQVATTWRGLPEESHWRPGGGLSRPTRIHLHQNHVMQLPHGVVAC